MCNLKFRNHDFIYRILYNSLWAFTDFILKFKIYYKYLPTHTRFPSIMFVYIEFQKVFDFPFSDKNHFRLIKNIHVIHIAIAQYYIVITYYYPHFFFLATLHLQYPYNILCHENNCIAHYYYYH